MQEDASRDRLTPRQERAVLALLREPSVEAAAQAVGVNPTTLWRWGKMPLFRAALEEARRQAFASATTTVVASASAAAVTLRQVAAGEGDPPPTAAARVAAARAILDHARASIELDDLAAWLERLEARLAVMEQKAVGADAGQKE